MKLCTRHSSAEEAVNWTGDGGGAVKKHEHASYFFYALCSSAASVVVYFLGPPPVRRKTNGANIESKNHTSGRPIYTLLADDTRVAGGVYYTVYT